MPQTVDLPDDLAAALIVEASRLGLSLADYAIRLLESNRPPASAVHTGAELVAYWQSEGVVGTRSDIADSPAEARRLREQAQRRGA